MTSLKGHVCWQVMAYDPATSRHVFGNVYSSPIRAHAEIARCRVLERYPHLMVSVLCRIIDPETPALPLASLVAEFVGNDPAAHAVETGGTDGSTTHEEGEEVRTV